MATIFTISTKNLSHTTSLRCVLGLAYLLVMVSGCSYPQIAATSVNVMDIGNYQSARTLKYGIGTIRVEMPKFLTAQTGILNVSGKATTLNLAIGGGLALEMSATDYWQFGISANVSTRFIEMYGFTGDGGYSFFTKAQLPVFQAEGPIVALMLDYTTLVGNRSSGAVVLRNGKAESAPLSWFNDAPNRAVPIMPPTITMLDTGKRWSVSSTLQRVGISVPVSFRVSPNSDFTLRTALHYSSYRLGASELTKVISLPFGNPESTESRDLSTTQNLFLPSLAFGYSVRDTLTNLEYIHFELSAALWNGSPTFSFATVFRCPIYLIPYQRFMERYERGE